MFKGFLLGVVAVIAVAVLFASVAIQTGVIPANADAWPFWVERWAAGTSLHATLVRQAPTGANSIPLTNENLITGIKLYGQHCAICHGTAKGDVAATPLARGLYPRPPQLASDGVEDDPQGFSFWKIKHGIRWTAMPS